MNIAALGRLPVPGLAILVGGLIWRYRYDKFGWTTRSSQLYETAVLRWGSPLFHFGVLMVLSVTSAACSSRRRGPRRSASPSTPTT